MVFWLYVGQLMLNGVLSALIPNPQAASAPRGPGRRDADQRPPLCEPEVERLDGCIRACLR